MNMMDQQKHNIPLNKTAATCYMAIVAFVFLCFAIVFDTFPRSTYSSLEKRDLTAFPEFSMDKLTSGAFAKGVSSWFSDSEPYRDLFLAMSMQVKDWMRVSFSEEQITFHASADAMTEGEDDALKGDGLVEGFDNSDISDGTAKIANAGILIVGKGDKVRALMAFGGSAK